MTKISLIFPCYNEEEGIPNLKNQLMPVVEKLNEKYDVELIFVDDGSRDNTYNLLEEHFGKIKEAKIIRHEQNQNLGGALKTGFASAEGELIATFDSDCSFPPALLLEMLPLLDEKTDIVTVSAYHPQGKIESNEKTRIFLSWVASTAYRLLLNSGIYSHGGLTRVYKREVIENVKFKANDYLSVTELLARAILKGYQVKELPTSLRKRQFGASKMKIVKVAKSHALFMAKIFFHRLLGTQL